MSLVFHAQLLAETGQTDFRLMCLLVVATVHGVLPGPLRMQGVADVGHAGEEDEAWEPVDRSSQSDYGTA